MSTYFPNSPWFYCRRDLRISTSHYGRDSPVATFQTKWLKSRKLNSPNALGHNTKALDLLLDSVDISS